MPETATPTDGPISLLRSIEQAESSLFLSYTADLGFFERFAYREIRRQEAKATVVSDPTKLNADPALVSGSGARYVSGVALLEGGYPFHPKLIVIGGTERVSIAIGSGNLTISGWHKNAELWTFAHADQDQTPRLIGDVARFLNQLIDGRIRLSSTVVPAVSELAELLAGFETADEGPAAVSSLDGPIIDHLPEGPVDELRVYSPFFDRRLNALEALRERLLPQHLEIRLQRTTSVDGNLLSTWAEDNGATLLWCDEHPYRHGKLLEWRNGSTWSSLTGSPNLSAPALLHGVSATGNRANCELAVVSEAGGSIAPPGNEMDDQGPSSLTFSSREVEEEGSSVTILAATLDSSNGLVIQLAAPLPTPARIQTHSDEHEWVMVEPLSQLGSGESQFLIPICPIPPGSAIRLFGDDLTSNTAFITDPDRATRRPWKKIGPEVGTLSETLEDGNFKVIYEIAEKLGSQLLASGIASPSPATSKPAVHAKTPRSSEKTLADYLAVSTTVLPESWTRWALGLPPLPGFGTQSGPSPEIHLVDETGDEAADAGIDPEPDEPPSVPLTIENASPHRRRSMRQFCESALERCRNWPDSMRLMIGRLVLNGVAGKLWNEAESDPILVRMIGELSKSGDPRLTVEAEAAATYVGIALAILRSRFDVLSVYTEERVRFGQAADLGRETLEHFSPALVAETGSELFPKLGETITSEYIEMVVERIRTPMDPVQAALKMIGEETNLRVTSEDGRLEVLDPLPSSFVHQLLRIASFVDGPESVVFGTIDGGVIVEAIWNEPDLVILRHNENGTLGRWFRGNNTHPRTVTANWVIGVPDRDNLPTPADMWMPGQEPPEEIRWVIEELATLPNGVR